MAPPDNMVTLVSMEGDEFHVRKEVASMSSLIKTMIEEDAECTESIPLPNVEAPILKKVIEYCEHHYNNPPEEIAKPLKSSNLAEVVSEWDYQFITENGDQKVLFALILAANYLNVKPLLDLSVAKVATMIKGKTPEEIRRIFNIVNDFSPEEEAQVLVAKNGYTYADSGSSTEIFAAVDCSVQFIERVCDTG